jgi:hypothetical protein
MKDDRFHNGQGMAVSSTLFQHKNIHLQMWGSPDGSCTNQIDHVMIDSHHTSDIMDVRSCREADCDSDHYMVKVKLQQRIAAIGKTKGQKSIKYNMDKLKNVFTAWEYKKEIEEYLGKSDIAGQTIEST